MRRPSTEGGFTLLEALVAMMILALVVVNFLGTRTGAVIDAADANNWRLARELAERYLSEIQAGALEVPPENRTMLDIEDYPGFRYQVLIGEAAISDVESEVAETSDYGSDESDGAGNTDRVAWQQERERLREARSSGMSMLEYDEALQDEELEERTPSETDIEDVAVVVYFPNVRPSSTEIDPDSTFMLKAKVSTLAIQCLTPEQAEVIADQRGESGGSATDAMGDR